MPDPNADHVFVLGLYRAMLLAGTPPALVKNPATSTSPSGSTAMAETDVVTPGTPTPGIHPAGHCPCVGGATPPRSTKKTGAHQARSFLGHPRTSTSVELAFGPRSTSSRIADMLMSPLRCV